MSLVQVIIVLDITIVHLHTFKDVKIEQVVELEDISAGLMAYGLLDGLHQGVGLAGAGRPEHEVGRGPGHLADDGLDRGELLGVVGDSVVEALHGAERRGGRQVGGGGEEDLVEVAGHLHGAVHVEVSERGKVEPDVPGDRPLGRHLGNHLVAEAEGDCLLAHEVDHALVLDRTVITPLSLVYKWSPLRMLGLLLARPGTSSTHTHSPEFLSRRMGTLWSPWTWRSKYRTLFSSWYLIYI